MFIGVATKNVTREVGNMLLRREYVNLELEKLLSRVRPGRRCWVIQPSVVDADKLTWMEPGWE